MRKIITERELDALSTLADWSGEDHTEGHLLREIIDQIRRDGDITLSLEEGADA